ncbi:MAG: flagellar motor protein MotB [Eubacterium sp.]|nr:flagellar motor protein MotB [Eubacterium sp.]MCM1216238.1 flagellar motor protein MotB [Lachnospiraceae bacterium]MCM1304899.1 flagellar motor protein MotB [Butyrivibrio sp.]MCM1343335.1 flagellar motor protein MotB [Muribaculaceae bacterium]MCM1238856.1 flagellar motor protein MotB [Lachnospiraceae bacterium]
MAKRQEDTPPAGSPAWMSTFSDLMNLLLCFFVMLFAMSTLEESKLHELVAAMNNTVSIFDGGANAIGDGMLISNGVSQLNELDQYINSTGKTAESPDEGKDIQDYVQSPEAMQEIMEKIEEAQLLANEELAENVAEALQEDSIADQVDVSFTAQYVQLTMNGALLFDSGSAELKTESEQILLKVGGILQYYGNGIIEIEGHTDNVPINSSQYPSNEELSDARALSVFYFLKDNTSLDPMDLRHAGMGERVPIADNSTAEGRSRNRRVEIRIYNSAM